jgi:hypothetical protein
MNFFGENGLIKTNSINFVVIIASINYFILHHIASKTFSPSAFSSDSGWGSIWTIVFILAGQAVTLWLLFNANSKREMFDWAILLYIYQVYCYREADLHRLSKQWPNLTNLKFYTKSAAPVEIKIIGITILVLFAIGAIYLFIKYFLRLFNLFIKGEPFTVALGLWAVYLFVSQILDRSRFFNDSTTPIIKNIEEMLELTAALFALLAILQYIRYKSSRVLTKEAIPDKSIMNN